MGDPVSVGRQRNLNARAVPGLISPCSRSKNLRPAGNPAVMAPRFRPVALRPRLSAGLPAEPGRKPGRL